MPEPTRSAPPSSSAAISCNRVPAWLDARLRRWPGLSARYLMLDVRSLGLVRIYLGCVLLGDLLRRIPGIRIWYTNEGPLPNHVMLWRPVAKYQFSLFFLASNLNEAWFLFALCGLVFALFALGYRTKLMHFLSFVAICSLHNRLAVLEDGSEVTTRLLTFWTLFLPLGARFSVDALRARREPELRPAASLVVPAILLQLSLLYVFNVVHKDGETWRDGSAVHYVLQQDRIVTWLGELVRPYVTPLASKVMTYSALVVEAALPVLIWWPIGWKVARRIAIVLAIGLHLSFYAMLNLAMFSFNMIGFYLLLLTERDWYWLSRLPHAFAAAVQRRVERALRVLGVPELPPTAAPEGVRARLIAWAPQLREAVVVLFAIACGSQMLLENRAVPGPLRVQHQPLWMRLLVEYPRLREGWSMFAPEVPTGDFMLYSDAITVDGRHVDPINEAASRVAKLPLHAIPPRLGMSDNWCDYTVNVVGAEDYHHALGDFIRNYAKRTKRPQDRIVSFKVWVMEDQSPKPGSQVPTDTRQWLVFEDPGG